MELTKVFNYDGECVTFKNENGTIMVNATQMAKPFNKAVYEYTRLPSTKELIRFLSTYLMCDREHILKTHQGSSVYGGGTYMHELLSLEFAKWLDVDMYSKFNDHVNEDNVIYEKYGITPSILALYKPERQEIEFYNVLKRQLDVFDIAVISQYRVSKYKIDFYIPEYNLAIEYDERHHNNYKAIKRDAQRQDDIVYILKCKFLRLDYRNTHEENSAIVLKHIFNLAIDRIQDGESPYDSCF